jgi:hypothetical protein
MQCRVMSERSACVRYADLAVMIRCGQLSINMTKVLDVVPELGSTTRSG